MLGELWNIVKADFKKRLVLYVAVDLSFSIFASFPNILVKLLTLAIFSVTAILFMTIFASRFLPQIWLTATHRRGYRIPVSDEIKSLSKEIGAPIKELRIRGKLRNAYVIGKSLVLGIDLLKDLNFNERQAVVAHELGHIKEKHGLVRLLLTIPFLAVPFYSWQTIYSPTFFSEQFTQVMLAVMVSIAMLAYVIVVMIPINWYLEVRADRIAAKFIGKEHIKSALLILSDKKNRQEPSEDHPPIAERVKLIEKLEG